MSTVEKAFLKSLEDKGLDDVESQLNIPAVPQKQDAKKIASSRKSISNMKQNTKYSESELLKRKLIYANMKDKELLNQFRNLRTRLLRHCNNQNFVTLVTSVVPDEDTSLVSANLAACFALDESKTSMLIEAHINEPRINEIFDLSKRPGIIDFLEGEDCDTENYLHKTGVSRLRVVPSGHRRENASEYFTSDKMHQFIKELVTRYPDRFPIINTPSILHSADARILLDMCDQALLVVPYGKCSEEDIFKAVLTIGQDKLAGILLNNF